MLLVNKNFSKFIKRIEVNFDNIVVIKISRTLVRRWLSVIQGIFEGARYKCTDMKLDQVDYDGEEGISEDSLDWDFASEEVMCVMVIK